MAKASEAGIHAAIGDLAERMVALAAKKRVRVVVTGGAPFARWTVEATPDGFSSREIVQDVPDVEAEPDPEAEQDDPNGGDVVPFLPETEGGASDRWNPPRPE
jgi:hypothetical protein